MTLAYAPVRRLARHLEVMMLGLWSMLVFSAVEARAEVVWDSGWVVSDCYEGLDVRVKVFAPMFADSAVQQANLYIRNRYTSALWVTYDFTINGNSLEGRTSRLEPGENSPGGAWTMLPVSSSFRVSGRLVKGKTDSSWGEPYMACDR